MSEYWTVVYRVKGMESWWPWDSALHWHSTRDAAMADIHALLTLRPAIYKKCVDLEFAPAKVEVGNE